MIDRGLPEPGGNFRRGQKIDLVGVGVSISQFSADMKPGVESELIDLGAMSMRALRHVMQQASHPRVTAGGGERLD